MRRAKSGFISKVLAAAAVAAVLLGSLAVRAPAQASAEDEVLNLQKKFQAATVSGDATTVASLMADDAIFIHGNAAKQTKTEFLAGIKNGQLAFSAYDLSDPKVMMFKGGAIVTGIVDITFKARPGALPDRRALCICADRPCGFMARQAGSSFSIRTPRSRDRLAKYRSHLAEAIRSDSSGRFHRR